MRLMMMMTCSIAREVDVAEAANCKTLHWESRATWHID